MKNIYLPFLTLLCFLSISQSSIGQTQTGPGGVGTSTSISIWLDAGQLSLNDGDLVSSWSDISGNTNNAVQLTAANQPVYSTTTTINGQPGVLFDGSNDSLVISATNSLNSESISWFVVAQANTTLSDNGRGIIKSVYNTSGDLWGTQYRRLTTYSEWFSYARNSSNVVTPASVFQLTQSSINHRSPFICSANWRTNDEADSKINGNAASVATGRNMPASTHIRTVIGRRNQASSFFSGLIGEVIVFNSQLNSAQAKLVNNYLNAKYNITIGGDDNYSFEATHNNDLAGIGRENASNQHLNARGQSIVEFTAGSLGNGEYLIWAHDNNSFATNLVDVPNSYLTSFGERMTRTWRVAETGSTGTVTISFDLTGITFGHPDDYELLIDADGDFTSGATIISGTLVGDIVSFTVTGAQLSNGNFFTIANSNASVIRSIVSGQDWNAPSTWSCSCIPLSSSYVTIMDNHVVNLTDTRDVARLTINTNGELSIGAAGVLNINENLSVVGTINSVATGLVNFNGSTTQIVNTSGTINFGCISLNNTNDVQLQSGNYTQSGVLTLTNGDLDLGGNRYTFLSTASGTASIDEMSGAGTILNMGDLRVQRFIPAGVAGYRNLGSPQTLMPLSEWDQELFISGPGFPDGCAFSSNGCYRSARFWNAATQAYVGIADINELIVNGTATEIWLGDNLTSFSQNTLQSSGDLELSLSKNITIRNGWNLVANPFLSPIDFDDIVRNSAGTGNYHYVWDPSTNGFQYWDGGAQSASVAHLNNGILSAFQGFWVFHTGANTTITINQNAKRATASDLFLRQSVSNQVNENFNVTLGSSNTEGKVITELRFNDKSNFEFDYFDVPQPPKFLVDGKMNAIYSKSRDGRDVVINTIPNQDECFEMPLLIDVSDKGKYELTFSNIPNDYTISLKDELNGSKIEVVEATKIEFVILDEILSTDRFKLMFEKFEPCKMVEEKLSSTLIYFAQNELKIEFESPSQKNTIEVFNTLGQKVFYSNVINSADGNLIHSIPFKQNEGVYIIKISDENGNIITTQKFSNF